MTRFNNAKEFRDLVLSNLERLPPQQQIIAEYFLGNLEEIPFVSVPSLSERTGVSEATVVRFAQRIGFDGFTSMKTALTEMIRGKSGSRGEGEDLPDSSAEISKQVIAQELANINKLTGENTDEALRAAASALFNANQTYVFGMGISSILAELTGYLCTQVGIRATVLSTRFTSPLEQLVVLRPGDLLFVFSYPPFSAQTVEMVKDAHQRGITTVAVTDRLTAPVAPYTDHLFRVRGNNKMFTNAVGAATVFLNILVTEIAVLHGNDASRAVGRINRILSEDENLIT